jgi:hypothetical protein
LLAVPLSEVPDLCLIPSTAFIAALSVVNALVTPGLVGGRLKILSFAFPPVPCLMENIASGVFLALVDLASLTLRLMKTLAFVWL